MREIVQSAHTIAIVGLSPSELRASYFVGFYLQRHGYHIVPVNPTKRDPGREQPTITHSDSVPVDVVDVFRKRSAVPAIARRRCRSARARSGSSSVSSALRAEIAERGGLKGRDGSLLEGEHARHMGRMHWFGLNTGVVSGAARIGRAPAAVVGPGGNPHAVMLQ